jgi:hypothetical protein
MKDPEFRETIETFQEIVRAGSRKKRYIRLALDGDALRQFEMVDDGEHVRLVVRLGDESYTVMVRRNRTEFHTLPDDPGGRPSLDDVAEVVGRLFVAVGTGVF